VRAKAVHDYKAKTQQQAESAKGKFSEAKELHEKGEVVAALSAMNIAISYAPKNKTYKSFHGQLKEEAKGFQAKRYIQAAVQAEGFHDMREAMENYLKGCSFDPPDPRPYYRLAILLKSHTGDLRNAMKYMRLAVKKDEDNPGYRVALGRIYAELGMKLNAKREFQVALSLDPDLADAKEGLRKVR